MSNGPDDSTAAGWNVELTAETADRAEEILRDFATDAELEMAVIVERSGGMIAGVATRQDVDVSTVGALVAGAFGAMGALANELGESRVTESLHHGAGDTIYLREVAGRFVLLGVASSSLPSGLVREKGAQVVGKLTGLLSETVEADVSPPAEEASPERIPPVEMAGPERTEGWTPFQSEESGGGSESVEPGSIAEPTGSAHTETSFEDGHTVPVPGFDTMLRRSETPAEADPSDNKESGGNPGYVFEIG